MIPRFTVRRILINGRNSRLVIPGQLWGRPTDCLRTVDRTSRSHAPNGEHVGLMVTTWRTMAFTLVETKKEDERFVVVSTLRMDSSSPGDGVHVHPHETSDLFLVGSVRDFPEGSEFFPTSTKDRRVDHIYNRDLKRSGL